MDKHERPYSCQEPGCEKLQGFTYSGGLLRHEREVHKKHGGPRDALMCPHASCKRSSGVGFTRKENLNEHLRRVHNSADKGESSTHREQIESDDEQSRKRRRPNSVSTVRSLSDTDDALREEVKRLRLDNEEKEQRMLRMEALLEKLSSNQALKSPQE
jgi:hypothetical protein